MKKILLAITACILLSCSQKDKLEQEISEIDVNLDVKRFDLAFASAEQTDLPVLKEKFPYLFHERFSDSVWFNKMEDTLQTELFSQVAETFAGFDTQTKALTGLFQHVKYYFPQMPTPTVVTVTNDVDYRNRVIYADTLLLIGLDNYLGADHKFYEGVQDYIRKDFVPERIAVDVAQEVAVRTVPRPSNRSFMAKMVYYGKMYYLIQQLLPEEPEEAVIAFAPEEYAWAVANESQIWRYFVDRNLLFSTDSKMDQRFLEPAPFSKFYLELDNESPGRLGRYTGWMIVRSYMENNEVSLQQMLGTPAEEIFKKSSYKPLK